MRLAAFAVSMATVAAVSLWDAAPAAADTQANSIIKYRNASDPFTMGCFDFSTGFGGMCMFTSSDIGSGQTTDNPYPMSQTYLYTLASGLNPGDRNNWVDHGVVLSESSYSWAASNAKHLWAPAAALGPDLSYLLYVPDVSDKSSSGVHTSSHIGVSKSAWGQLSGFTYVKQMSIPGYASDPSVIEYSPSSTKYIVWADGDFSNCGGLSMAQLDSSMTDIVAGTAQQITITGSGFTSMANCGGKNRPYLEGASLYYTGDWGTGAPGPYLLVFAAKPTNGQEVIAYATSSSATGSYAYKGVIMNGDSVNEFTNQASIQRNNDLTGFSFIYHRGDGSANHNRTVQGQCITFSNGSFTNLPLSRTAISSFKSCAKNY